MQSKSDLSLERFSCIVFPFPFFPLCDFMTMDWLWNDSIDGVMERGTSFHLLISFGSLFFFIAGTRRMGIEKKGGAGDVVVVMGLWRERHSKVEIRAQVRQYSFSQSATERDSSSSLSSSG